MFVGVVESGLEKFVRQELPLPEDVGDVAFEVPNSTWAAQLSRVTVNLFLYDVARSSHPVRAATRRELNGTGQKRTPQPMVELSYLASAWAGSIKDEHLLLGDLISRLVAVNEIPPELMPQELSSSAALSFADDSLNKNREIWSGLGGQLKASFTLHVHVAADTFDWVAEAPPVERVEGLAAPIPSAEDGSSAISRRVPQR